MLSPIQSALTRIYNTIPMEVLKAAFEDEASYDVSMDELIKKEVILGRVRDDVSQRMGKIKRIVLEIGWAKYTAPPSAAVTLAVAGAFSTFHIPAEQREYRDMLCVLDLSFPYSLQSCGQANFLSSCSLQGNTASQLASAALQNITHSNQVSLPTAMVAPGNVIIFNPPLNSFIPWIVRVRLKYDEEFSGLDINAIQTFNQICEIATKMYIYNKLIFKIESNLTYRGLDLGVFKEIVGQWNDLGEKYDELLIASTVDIFSPDRLKSILARVIPRV